MPLAWSAAPELDGLMKEALNELSNQEFRRTQERGRELRNQMETGSDIYLDEQSEASPNQIPNNETPCFTIKRIKLIGPQADDFHWAIDAASVKNDKAIDRCIGVNGINIIVSRIQNALIQKGYITSRIFIGTQDLLSKELTLTLIPGTVSETKLADQQQSFVFIKNAVPPPNKGILNLRDIEQALENLKRVPTADADIAIAPAANGQAGASDMLITYKQGFPLRLSLSLDDAGSKATGVYQGNITVSVDNPLRLSDLFYAGFNHDLGGGDSGKRGSESKTLHYSIPFRYWLLSMNFSESDYYQSVAGLTETYIYSGHNKQLELGISRTVWRSAQSKLLMLGHLRQKKSWNYIDDTEVEVQRRATTDWKAGINFRTRMAQTTWDSTLAYRRGVGALGAMRAPEEVYNEGTSRYQIVTLDSSLSMPFTFKRWNFRYSATGRAQFNQTKLLPQERFSIGGRYTVRGFDGESSLMGERGLSVRNDFGWLMPVKHYTEPYLGLDVGRVGGAASKTLAGQNLAGMALGIKGQWQGFYYDAFYGWSLYRPDRFSSDNTFGFSLNYSI